MLSTTEIIVMHTFTLGSHNALDDLVLDLYCRGPDDDLTSVETCSPRFMYICTINKTVVLN